MDFEVKWEDPGTQGNEGREKTFKSNLENHSVYCHPMREEIWGGNFYLSNGNLGHSPAGFAEKYSRWPHVQTSGFGEVEGAFHWGIGQERKAFTFPSGWKPRAEPKIRKLKLNKGIQPEPFSSKAARIWATLSSGDHQTETCKWIWELDRYIGKGEKWLWKVHIRASDSVTGRKAALNFCQAFWDTRLP